MAQRKGEILEFNGIPAWDIHVVCGHPAALDEDIARLFSVPAKRPNKQVKRDASRFGDGFAPQLSDKEHANLRSQIATSSSRIGAQARV